jgi:hypothetical protein
MPCQLSVFVSHHPSIHSFIHSFIHSLCALCTCHCHGPEKHNNADQFVSTSSSCPDMTKEVCDSVAYIKSCCPSCEATFARLSLCSGQEYFKKYNCKSAEQCLNQGIAPAAIPIGVWTTMVATAAVALVFSI